MPEETITNNKVIEPTTEPAPALEPAVETSLTPEPPQATAQPVEPLDPKPEQVRSGAGPELQTAPEPPTQAPEILQEPVESPVSPEPQAEPASSETSQPVESVPEPVSEPVPQPEQETASELTSQPEPTPEPAPTPQTQTSIPPLIQTGLARQLLVKARETIQFRKRKKLEKIMGLFLKKSKITNDDVEKLLHVSDATATRYLSQLKQEGKIKQEGKTGHAVSYSRI